MTITADGGWLAAILLILLLIVGVMAYRKRWPSRRPAFVVVGGLSVDESQQKTAREPEKKFSDGRGSKLALYIGKILLWVLLILVGIFLIIHFGEEILGLSGWTIPHSKSVQTMPPQPVNVGPTKADVLARDRAERNRIEGERFVSTLQYGERHPWIRVPDGGYVTTFTVDDHKVVGTQCSSSIDEPLIDSSGEECQDGVTAYWIRFYVWSADEGPVTVRYQFHYAF